MGNEQRSGEDRRATEVSHLTLYNKAVEHDHAIKALKSDVADMRTDLRGIKSDLAPISKGVTSIVFLFKLALALGALSAAGVGVIEFWEVTQAYGD